MPSSEHVSRLISVEIDELDALLPEVGRGATRWIRLQTGASGGVSDPLPQRIPIQAPESGDRSVPAVRHSVSENDVVSPVLIEVFAYAEAPRERGHRRAVERPRANERA
jgi:hypothetical protein